MDYPIDYSLYSTEEIVKLVEFMHLIEQYHDPEYTVNDQSVLSKYHDFTTIINNQAEEKKIGKAFEKQTGLSIYKTIKTIKSTLA